MPVSEFRHEYEGKVHFNKVLKKFWRTGNDNYTPSALIMIIISGGTEWAQPTTESTRQK